MSAPYQSQYDKQHPYRGDKYGQNTHRPCQRKNPFLKPELSKEPTLTSFPQITRKMHTQDTNTVIGLIDTLAGIILDNIARRRWEAAPTLTADEAAGITHIQDDLTQPASHIPTPGVHVTNIMRITATETTAVCF